jgi:hypothetical protein
MCKNMQISLPGCFVAKQRIVKKLYIPSQNTYFECSHIVVGKRGMTLDIMFDVEAEAQNMCIKMESECNNKQDILFDLCDDGIELFWHYNYFFYEDDEKNIFIE